jgi:hypothetical protein
MLPCSQSTAFGRHACTYQHRGCAAVIPDGAPTDNAHEQVLGVSREFAWLSGGGVLVGLIFGFATS